MDAGSFLRLQTSKYVNFAGLAVLLFDYSITFESETRWVWGRKWDVTRVAFTFSRYLPFAGAGLTAYAALRQIGEHPTSKEENIFHIVGIIAAEALLIVRTYAFWKCNRKLLVGLLVYGAITIAGALAVNLSPKTLVPESEQHSPQDRTPTLINSPMIASRNGAIVYAFLMAYEIVLLCLMVYKRFRDYRDIPNSLVSAVYRDAIMYILCIALITMANVIIDARAPIEYSDMLDIPQIVAHSVLATRILFNLRESDKLEDEASVVTTMSSLRVRPRSAEVSRDDLSRG
ncbi:hypothetical protein BV22DRAFT_1197323 [Leucogyrophana mollusca]|uniref:Uncharacterized protein n=1 Tax=Leucogyrophana mollusca TaxID=85980 RepID=A0ACB8BBA6_9AGAM|nr:hypothetical protein BV22DRAFT_1197323 [Leucogyrophana mollusca]